MSQSSDDRLQFSINESVWLRDDAPAEEILSMALEPDITVEENGNDVTIKGYLRLTGEYKPAEVSNPAEGSNAAPFRTIDEIMETNNGTDVLEHHFPIDITIPANRVPNLEELYVIINSFDYELSEQRHIQLQADLELTGLTQPEKETDDRSEAPSVQPAPAVPKMPVSAPKQPAAKPAYQPVKSKAEKSAPVSSKSVSAGEKKKASPAAPTINLAAQKSNKKDQAANPTKKINPQGSFSKKEAEVQKAEKVETKAPTAKKGFGNQAAETKAPTAKKGFGNQAAETKAPTAKKGFGNQAAETKAPTAKKGFGNQAAETKAPTAKKGFGNQAAETKTPTAKKGFGNQAAETKTPAVKKGSGKSKKSFVGKKEQRASVANEEPEEKAEDFDDIPFTAPIGDFDEMPTDPEDNDQDELLPSFEYQAFRKPAPEEPAADHPAIAFSERTEAPQPVQQPVQQPNANQAGTNANEAESPESNTQTNQENENSGEADSLYLTQLLAGKEPEQKTSVKIYIVQSGDSLESISDHYKVPVTSLLRKNQLPSAAIEAGELLYIPQTAKTASNE